MNKREIQLCLNSVHERAERLQGLIVKMSQRSYRMHNGEIPTKKQLDEVISGAVEHYALKEKLSAMLKEFN